jgi:zinc transporter ZupT
MEVFLLTIAASAGALAGGYTAIRSKRWLHSALALTSGLVLGLVTFDLLPEIFSIVQSEKLDPVWPMIAMTAGFLLFHFFEQFIPLHESSEESYGPHRHPRLGTARALALTGHSFLDGLSIGVGLVLYIAASNLLPQAHSQDSSRKTIGLTILGVIFIFIITRLA